VTLLLIAAFIIAALPLTGSFDVQAKGKPASKIRLSGYSEGYSTVVLRWNKIKKPEKGYAVFVDGACVRKLNKKTTSYAVAVAPGSSHSFQIKTWKKVKKTKNINGRKKKVTAYKYGKASNKVSVETPAPDNTGSASGSNPAPATNRVAITVTDYKGDKTTLYKEGNKTYLSAVGGGPMQRADLVKINRFVDGEWTDGEWTFCQKNGTTLYYHSSPSSYGYSGGAYVGVYNGDENRVKMEIQEEVRNFKEYKPTDRKQADPIQVPYIMSNDGKYRIAKPYFGKYIDGIWNDTPNEICFYADDHICGYDGFIDDTVHVKVWYDWNGDGNWTDDEYVGMDIASIKADDSRLKALEICKAAVAYYGTDSYVADMIAIEAYLFKNYAYDYPDQASGLNFRCSGGCIIQETWSIYKYGVYGYIGCPSAYNGAHNAFYPIDNPYNKTVYFEAQGYLASEAPGSQAYNENLQDLENRVETAKSMGI